MVYLYMLYEDLAISDTKFSRLDQDRQNYRTKQENFEQKNTC
jgi:hypothetical protein